MKLRSKLLIAGAAALAIASPSLADINYTQGAGTVIFAFTCFVSKVCPAHVIVNSSGTEINTASNPAQVSLANTGANATAIKTDGSGVTQPVSAASLPLPTGAATSANQATEISSLATIASNTGAAVPAGTNIIGKVGIDQTTPGTTNGVQLPTTTNGGAATVKGGVATVNGGSTYQAVAASQTATVLQSSTGAAGDYLSHCDIYPTSTSPGVVTVFDNTNTAATSAILFPGGASSVSNLVPFAIPVGAVSTAGAWKVTTGANVSVVCYGKFS